MRQRVRPRGTCGVVNIRLDRGLCVPSCMRNVAAERRCRSTYPRGDGTQTSHMGQEADPG